MAHPMMLEGVWFEKYKVDDAEKLYQEHRARELGGLVVQASSPSGQSDSANSDLAGQIARARQNIQNTLNSGVGLGIGVTVDSPEFASRLSAVERENAELRQVVSDLQAAVKKLTVRVDALDKTPSAPSTTPAPAAGKKQEAAVEDDDDDDVDLFASDSDDEEAFAKVQAQRKAETDAKKPKKEVIAKSSILLDVKPWDDETDMKDIEKVVRNIETDGLLWGASKLVPVGYGIKKLQICCVVEDDKVGTDFLEEEITKHEDLVQSVDIAAFNKI